MKNLKKETTEKLAALRKSKGYTQAELAELTGLQVSNISRIERGQQNLSLDTLEKYCTALGQNPEFILQESDSAGDSNTEYRLKIFDDTLIKFSMQRTGHGDIKLNIEFVNDELKHLMPVSLEPTADSLRLWLKRRHIPGCRAYVHELLASVGLDLRDTKGIIDMSKALSLNDSYWVEAANCKQYFEDVNLYDNSFSEQLGRIAFVGMQQQAAHCTSPEFTTGGMLRKAWLRPADRQGVWLYKGGTEGDSGTEGNEVFSEYYASQLAYVMGLNAVSYNLEMFKGILSSTCPLFTSRDISFVPVGDIPGIYEIEDVIELYKQLGPRFYDELCDMLVFDALVYNKDRHFSNFGLLRDNRTGEFISAAPIFDNGASLFPFATRYDLSDLKSYALKQNPPYERSWDELMAMVLSARQKKELKRISAFRFTEHAFYNWPEWRLHILEKFLMERSNELLTGMY